MILIRCICLVYLSDLKQIRFSILRPIPPLIFTLLLTLFLSPQPLMHTFQETFHLFQSFQVQVETTFRCTAFESQKYIFTSTKYEYIEYIYTYICMCSERWTKGSLMWCHQVMPPKLSHVGYWNHCALHGHPGSMCVSCEKIALTFRSVTISYPTQNHKQPKTPTWHRNPTSQAATGFCGAKAVHTRCLWVGELDINTPWVARCGYGNDRVPRRPWAGKRRNCLKMLALLSLLWISPPPMEIFLLTKAVSERRMHDQLHQFCVSLSIDPYFPGALRCTCYQFVTLESCTHNMRMGPISAWSRPHSPMLDMVGPQWRWRWES